LQTVLQLVEKHKEGHHTYGISAQGAIADMKELGVWECILNKQAQISMATEAAVSILKIDQVVWI
jgi:chaperonin GroEL (HSP60 family)